MAQFPIWSRRAMLHSTTAGMGSLALAMMLGEEQARASEIDPLAVKTPPLPAKAKHVIHVFLEGGPSHIDSFDPKPVLTEFHGKTLSEKNKGEMTFEGTGLRSPFAFKKHGQSGLEISELFPHLAESADELCIVRSMKTDIPDHEPGMRMLTCGDSRLPRPSLGSWLLYGLGTENQSLPGFVVLNEGGMGQTDYWQSAFLSSNYQGTFLDTSNREIHKLLENIRSPYTTPAQQREQLTLLDKLNAKHREQRAEDQRLDARIRSFELAFAMQKEALDAFDTAHEPMRIREMYGSTPQARQMLLARRLVERGVRYVQVWQGGWDHHDTLKAGMTDRARDIDQPLGALLKDLKQIGILDETLVIVSGEFGRTPSVEGGQSPDQENAGRGHWGEGYSIVLAGGGIKKGIAYGNTDELGFRAVENPVHVHDLHATILHLMGFDHEKLTYRYAGRDFRLTDVYGKVVRDILA